MAVFTMPGFEVTGDIRTPTLLNPEMFPKLTKLIKRVKVKTATSLSILSLVAFTESDGDIDDVREAVIAADESVVLAGIVMNSQWNRQQVLEDNSSETAATLSLQFAAGTEIDVLLLQTNMIIPVQVKASEVFLFNALAACAGSDAIKNFVEGTDAHSAVVGRVYAEVTTVAAVQWACMRVTI